MGDTVWETPGICPEAEPVYRGTPSPGLGLELQVGGIHLEGAADHIFPPLLDPVSAHDEGVFQRFRVIFHHDVDPAPPVDPDHLRLHAEEGELQLGGLRCGQDGIGSIPLRDGSLPVGAADDADAGDRLARGVRHHAGDREPFLRRQPGGGEQQQAEGKKI